MTTANKKYGVLFVDDEKRILTALRSIFRREYDVYIADSGQEALRILSEHNINVIVSDQRMPGMLGNDLLAKVYQLYPKTMRVLLTGFMDKEAIIKTINEGEVYRFINKPWNNKEIIDVVAQAAKASEADLNYDSTNTLDAAITKDTQKEERAVSEPNQGVVIMGSNQELRNQIRHLCREYNINIYGAQNISQILGVISARSTIGVAIVELPVNSSEAIQTISLLKENRPELISIVLTDESDADTAVELINSGQVFRYLTKPIETKKLKNIVEQAFNRNYILRTNPKLQSRYKVDGSSNIISTGLKALFSSFNRAKS